MDERDRTVQYFDVEVEHVIAVRSSDREEGARVEVAMPVSSGTATVMVLRLSTAAVRTLAPALARVLEMKGLKPTEEGEDLRSLQ